MGEAKRRQVALQKQAQEAMTVDTPGGRIHVQWDHAASATPNAQLTFFAEFLAATGVYDTWVNTCPLNYTSPNAPAKKDVLGTSNSHFDFCVEDRAKTWLKTSIFGIQCFVLDGFSHHHSQSGDQLHPF